jgi:hypothetical protein
MSHRSETEKFTLRAGRQYAAACGQTLVSAFEDTLSGDLARLQMRRRLRSAFPGITRHTVDKLISELLTP